MRYRAPLFGVLAALVLGVAFYFLMYQPQARAQEELEAETAQLETQALQLRSQIASLRQIEENQLAIQAALARLDEFIPLGTAQPTALRQFQIAADAAGVEIESLTFSAPTAVADAPPTGEPGTELVEIQVTMTVEGGYFQAVDLLRRFEVEVPRALLVNSIAMSQAGEGFPGLSTTWTGSLFAVADVPSVPTAPEPEPEPDADAEDTETDPQEDGGAEQAAPESNAESS